MSEERETIRYRFEDLAERQQEQARARFLNAGPGDGYRYELDGEGGLLCRRKAVRERIPNATGGHVLLMEDGGVEFDLYGDRDLTESPSP